MNHVRLSSDRWGEIRQAGSLQKHDAVSEIEGALSAGFAREVAIEIGPG